MPRCRGRLQNPAPRPGPRRGARAVLGRLRGKKRRLPELLAVAPRVIVVHERLPAHPVAGHGRQVKARAGGRSAGASGTSGSGRRVPGKQCRLVELLALPPGPVLVVHQLLPGRPIAVDFRNMESFSFCTTAPRRAAGD